MLCAKFNVIGNVANRNIKQLINYNNVIYKCKQFSIALNCKLKNVINPKSVFINTNKDTTITIEKV